MFFALSASVLYRPFVAERAHGSVRRPFMFTRGATFQYFGIGMALAVVSVRRPKLKIKRYLPALRWLAAAALYVGLSRVIPTLPGPGAVQRRELLRRGARISPRDPAAAGPLTLPRGFGSSAQRLMSSRFMRLLGWYSYGTYLWHIAILRLLVKFDATKLLPGRRS